jgi:hypothetical protein
VGGVCLILVAFLASTFHVGFDVLAFAFLIALHHLIRWRTAFIIMASTIMLTWTQNVQLFASMATVFDPYVDWCITVIGDPRLQSLSPEDLALFKAILTVRSITVAGILLAALSLILGLVIRHVIKKRGILGLA